MVFWLSGLFGGDVTHGSSWWGMRRRKAVLRSRVTTAYEQTDRFVREHGIDVVSRRYHAITVASHQLTLVCPRCQASTEIQVAVEDMPAIVELFARKST
jgi:hypothetical protein